MITTETAREFAELIEAQGAAHICITDSGETYAIGGEPQAAGNVLSVWDRDYLRKFFNSEPLESLSDKDFSELARHIESNADSYLG